MADINAKVIKMQSMKVAPRAARESNFYGPIVTMNATGTLSGNVKIAGVAAPNVTVRIYYRENGMLIEQAVTDVAGNYSFTGLDPGNLGAYYVTALDPQGSPAYNYTVTHDHLSAS